MGELVLHVGLMKTGTTSVQHALYDSRAALRDRGVEYVDVKQINQMLSFVAPLQRDPYALERFHPGLRRHLSESDTDFVELWRELVVAVRASEAPRVVLSAENLIYAGPRTIADVVESFAPREVRVVITDRLASKLVPSNYQQQGRTGYVGTFDGWARRELGKLAAPSPRGSLSSLRLHDLGTRWAQSASSVEHVHMTDDVNGGLAQIWRSLTGLTEPPPKSVNVKNISMPAELVEALQRRLKEDSIGSVAETRRIVHQAQESYLDGVRTAGFRWRLRSPIADWLDASYRGSEADWAELAQMLSSEVAVGELVASTSEPFEVCVERAGREIDEAARSLRRKGRYRDVAARFRRRR